MNVTLIMEDVNTSVETFPQVIPVHVELDTSLIPITGTVMVGNHN